MEKTETGKKTEKQKEKREKKRITIIYYVQRMLSNLRSIEGT